MKNPFKKDTQDSSVKPPKPSDEIKVRVVKTVHGTSAVVIERISLWHDHQRNYEFDVLHPKAFQWVERRSSTSEIQLTREKAERLRDQLELAIDDIEYTDWT